MNRQVEDDGFYITLPSNASKDVFKNNTGSSFRVNLAQHIDLEGPWQVALAEISYPHTWHNLPDHVAYFEWRKVNDEEIHKQRIRGGYYNSVIQLEKEMESFFKEIKTDIHMKFCRVQKRFAFQASGQYEIRFFSTLAYMLGVKPGEWMHVAEPALAPFPADIKAGFYHLYCYSDVVTPQIVGDAYAPLLRTLRVQGDFGKMVTLTFNPAHYLPVSRKHIENIHIEIKSDQNVPVNFVYGKSVIRLHFRPVISQRSLR